MAKRICLTDMPLGNLRNKNRALVMEDLHDEVRAACLNTYEADALAEVMNRALQTKPLAVALNQAPEH